MLVLIAGVPLALSAQITSSYTNQITHQLLRTDVDNAFDVNYFGDFGGKSLLFLDYTSSAFLNLGYAAKLGGLYIAGVYSGNVLGMNSIDNRTDNTTELVGSNANVIGTNINTSDQPYSTTGSYNTIGLLFGFGKIGIEAVVNENISTATDNFYSSQFNYGGWNNYNGTNWSLSSGGLSNHSANTTTPSIAGTSNTVNQFTPTTNGTSEWTPALTVGTALTIGNLTLRPFIHAAVDFATNDAGAKHSYYQQAVGSGLPTYSSISEVSYWENGDYESKSDAIKLTARIGTKIETGAWLFDVDYTFYSPFYSASYLGSDGSTKSTVAGNAYSLAYTNYSASMSGGQTYAVYAYEADPSSETKHTIFGTVQYTASFADKLNIAIGFTPTVTIDNTSKSSSGSQVTTVVNTNTANPYSGNTTVYTKNFTGTSETTSSLDFSPVVNGGLKYAIIDKVLSFNLGSSINLAGLVSSTTTDTQPGYSSVNAVTTNYNGTIASSSYTSTIGTARQETSNYTFNLNQIATSLSWGFSWTLVEGITFDAMFASGALVFGPGSSNVLSPLGFTAQISIKK
jgi:hypothetical protein